MSDSDTKLLALVMPLSPSSSLTDLGKGQPYVALPNQAVAEEPPYRQLFPPFNFFGGKRLIAPAVWQRLGSNVGNYLEPFAGGLATLLARPGGGDKPGSPRRELANDLDGLTLNFWRATGYGDVEKLAALCDTLYHEAEMKAWHVKLSRRRPSLMEQLLADTAYFDLEVAARWVWGIRAWIGSGYTDPDVPAKNKMPRAPINRWQGGSALTHLLWLQDRLKRVTFFCGGWERAVRSWTQTLMHGITAAFLDPPYPNEGRSKCYTHDDGSVAKDARQWALANGDNPGYRIAYCGYFKTHDQEFPPSWERLRWKAVGGYGLQGKGRWRANATQETIWFSPHCLKVE
jgi:site-specific DNA-adenine methylase